MLLLLFGFYPNSLHALAPLRKQRGNALSVFACRVVVRCFRSCSPPTFQTAVARTPQARVTSRRLQESLLASSHPSAMRMVHHLCAGALAVSWGSLFHPPLMSGPWTLPPSPSNRHPHRRTTTRWTPLRGTLGASRRASWLRGVVNPASTSLRGSFTRCRLYSSVFLSLQSWNFPCFPELALELFEPLPLQFYRC